MRQTKNILIYFLISYVLVWVIATPIMLLALHLHGIQFLTSYKAFIGSIPLYQSTLIVYLSAIPSYYIPTSLCFKKVKQELTKRFVLRTALSSGGLVFCVWERLD